MFAPVGTRRTFEAAIAQIADRVRAGDLRPGDRLPSERDLAATMEISRPTLREAVQVLAEAGVVEVRPGAAGGTYVVTDFVPRALLRRSSDRRTAEIPALLEARRVLEPRVAQLAAARAGDADLEAMAETIERQRELLEQGPVLAQEDRFLQLDLRFHHAMGRASGNVVVARMVGQLLHDLELARDTALHVPVVVGAAIAVHERTLAAIRSGDPEAVEEAMDEHLGQLERSWEEATGRPLAPPAPAFLPGG